VGVDNALNVREVAIQYKVSRSVARWVQVALYYLAGIEVDNYHVGCLHYIVVYARGFDDNKTFLAVDARYITPGKDYQVLLYKVKISLENFFFQFF
jgi:hypothetical protein